jgi:hypothetical protein
VSTDEVEYRDATPHSTYADANLGDFNDFINKWDSAHLTNYNLIGIMIMLKVKQKLKKLQD